MERIFTEDVLNETGKVKFPVGMVRDFPRETWENIEQASGKSLADFTDIPAGAFQARNFKGKQDPNGVFVQLGKSKGTRPERKKLTRKETG